MSSQDLAWEMWANEDFVHFYMYLFNSTCICIHSGDRSLYLYDLFPSYIISYLATNPSSASGPLTLIVLLVSMLDTQGALGKYLLWEPQGHTGGPTGLTYASSVVTSLFN